MEPLGLPPPCGGGLPSRRSVRRNQSSGWCGCSCRNSVDARTSPKPFSIDRSVRRPPQGGGRSTTTSTWSSSPPEPTRRMRNTRRRRTRSTLCRTGDRRHHCRWQRRFLLASFSVFI